MAGYDPTRDDETRDDETKYIPSSENEEPLSPVVVLPDGTKPVPLGSGVITGILGEGGMAIVYEIWNEKLGVKRAVKLLRPNSSKEIREQFDVEIKITAQLDHLNIINIHNVGVWNDLPYIEMEMVDGVSLAEFIKQQGALPLEVCTSIAIIICRSLNYTHHHEYTINNIVCKGLMHRDLKPGNILISKNGIVRLTDFGIAIPTDIRVGTSSGKIIGSMQYLAPEQLEEDVIDPRADIFAFGCILYEMLTGQKTYPDRNITRLIRKRLKNVYKPLSSYELNIPGKLIHLVNLCLQSNVNKRPKDIKDVMNTLNKIHNRLTSNTPESIIKSYSRGESIEETKIQTSLSLPLRKVANIALITVSVIIIIFFFFTYRQKFIQKSTQLASISKEVVPLMDIKETDTNIPPKDTSVKKEQITLHPDTSVLDTVNENQNGVIQHQNVNRKKTQIKSYNNKIHGNNYRKTPAARMTQNKKPVIKKSIRAVESIKSKSILEKLDSAITRQKGLAKNNPAPHNIVENYEVKSRSIIEKLEKKYNTVNPVLIMKKEDAANNYFNVLDIYKELHPSHATMKVVQLLKHRALVFTDQIDNSYYERNHINDGEFYLSKAQYLFSTQQYQRAIWILGIIKTSPVTLLNKKDINKKVLYYTAKCNTAIFNDTPTPEKKKSAMRSWLSVKSEFRKNQNHPYYAEAKREIKKISKKK